MVPFFSKDGKRTFNTFKTHCEELRTKPMYREPLKSRRCIVPATGYIEFTGPKATRPRRSTNNVKNNSAELLA